MRFFEKLAVAYFFGPPCIVRWVNSNQNTRCVTNTLRFLKAYKVI